jgi:hypothetical protein
VGDVHLHILVDDLFKRRFGHALDCWERRGEKLRGGKGEASFRDVHRAQLSGKVVEPTEKIGVYLLEAFDGSRLQSIE